MCVLPGHCPRAHRHHETAADNHPSPPPVRRWRPNALLLPSNHPCGCTQNRSRFRGSPGPEPVRALLRGPSCCSSNQPQPGRSGSEEQEGGASRQVSRYSPLTPPTLPQLMESVTWAVQNGCLLSSSRVAVEPHGSWCLCLKASPVNQWPADPQSLTEPLQSSPAPQENPCPLWHLFPESRRENISFWSPAAPAPMSSQVSENSRWDRSNRMAFGGGSDTEQEPSGPERLCRQQGCFYLDIWDFTWTSDSEVRFCTLQAGTTN